MHDITQTKGGMTARKGEVAAVATSVLANLFLQKLH